MAGNVKLNEKTGKWEFVFDAGRDPFTGKRKQIRRRGFANKSDAINAFAKLKAEQLEGRYLDPNAMLYDDYMAEYFRERAATLQHSTYEIQTLYYRTQIKDALGSLRLRDITPLICQRFVNDLSAAGLAPATVQLVFRVVYSSLKRAKAHKLIADNPAEAIKLPPVGKRPPAVWTLDEMNYFLREAPNLPNASRCIIGFELGLLTGLRQGEILGLRWQDVDLDSGNLYVRQVLTQAVTFKACTKNGGHRSLTMPERLIEDLRAHKERIEYEKARCPYEYHDNDLVLPTRDGRPMIPRNFRKEFYNTCERLNMPKIRFHDTRHTHATILVAQNVHIKLISERLGHKDIDTTLNTYSHVLPNMQRSVSDKLDKVLDF